MLKLGNIFNGVKVEFPSIYSVEESLRRITVLTLWSPANTSLSGDLTASGVTLCVNHVFVRTNGTHFSGQLMENDGEVVLVGVFVASSFQRMVGLAILTLLSFFAVAGGFGILMQTTGLNALEKLLAVAVWVGAISIFSALVIWHSSPDRKDMEIISNAINTSLSPATTEH